MSTVSSIPLEFTSVPIARPWYKLWLRAVVHPTAATFSDLLAESDTRLRRTLTWIIVTAVIGSLLSWAIAPGFIGIDTASEQIFMSAGVDFVILSDILIFLLVVSVLHIVARALRGQGSFREIAFLCACYWCPFILIHSVLSGVGVLSTASSPSTLGLSVFADMSAQSLWIDAVVFLLVLARAVYDIGVVRAVYGLTLPKAVVPPLVVVMMAIFLRLCFLIGGFVANNLTVTLY